MKWWALAAVFACSSCLTSRAPKSIYFVMIDRFENGDRSNDRDSNPADPQAFHGGDLQGVINRLDWIHEQGFDTVWLSPIFAMRTTKWHGYGAFHGYWTWDLNRIESRFGDEDTLKRLRDELEKRGMKLILDLVLNHVGPDAPMIAEHLGWFHKRGGITDWNDPEQLVSNDVHGLPDLATEQPEVFRYLLGATQHWIAVAHPAGFRLDAVKHLPLKFWEMFNGQVEGVKLGELLDGDPAAVAHTWAEGNFTSMFDFPLAFAMADVFCRGESPAKLAAVLTNDRRYPDASQLVTLVDNHDLPRLASLCGGDLERQKAALSFLFAVRGVPSMTWGTEIGATGEKEPENRASMQFIEHPLKEHVRAAQQQRLDSPALLGGSTVMLEADETHVVFARVATDRSTQIVRVENRTVTVTPGELQPEERPELITVRFEGAGEVVGSGPELGDWNPKNARTLPFELSLPRRGVFEFKRLQNGVWDEGANRVLFVTEPTTVRW